MKHIIKREEPPEFSDWKANDKMRHRPNWKRLPSGVKSDLHQSLWKEQGGICCYCEREIPIENSHVEHLRPKTLFPRFMFDYSNLLCSCQRELRVGDPRICGCCKGDWYDENLLVTPLDPDCEVRFAFAADGSIRPGRPDDQSARESISRLNLDCDWLRAFRKNVVEGLVDDDFTDDEIRASVTAWLETNIDGTFNSFHTTIKYLFRDYL